MCCLTGVRYAKADNASATSCFQHLNPATLNVQCGRRSAPTLDKDGVAFGYVNRGVGSAALFVATGVDSGSCADGLKVGNVTAGCPEGHTGKKIRFRVATSADNRRKGVGVGVDVGVGEDTSAASAELTCF
jgi:hypothetical protein